MFSFVRYQLISFIQSLKFIPPTAIFFVWVFILYAYKNVPILSSYGASSIAMYVILTWVTMSIFTLEEENEKHMLMLNLGGKIKYLLGKWITILLVIIPFLLLAVFFPIVTESFKGTMRLELYGMAFYSHFVFSILGMIVGTLFSATKFATRKYSWLLAVFTIVISISSKSLIEISTYFKWISWMLPPVFKVIEHMEGGDEILLRESMMLDTFFVFAYLFIGATILIPLFRKKES